MKAFFYDWGGANVWLFHAINNIRFEVWDQFMLLGTYLGGHGQFSFYLVLLTLFAVVEVNRPVQDTAAYQRRVKRWVTVIAVFSLAYWMNGLLLGYLKPMLDFPRPPLALPPEVVNIIGSAEYRHSLPSGHASFAMMVVASLWPVLKRKWRFAGVFFVTWVGISRVSLGAHFPADVLAGFISSLVVVLLAYLVIWQGLLLVARFSKR